VKPKRGVKLKSASANKQIDVVDGDKDGDVDIVKDRDDDGHWGLQWQDADAVTVEDATSGSGV